MERFRGPFHSKDLAGQGYVLLLILQMYGKRTRQKVF